MPPHGLIYEQKERRQLLKRVEELMPPKSLQTHKKRLKRLILKTPRLGLLITHGNSKIGNIDNFTIPPGSNFRGATCPGATELCENICYAKGGLFRFHEWKYYANWAYVLLWPERFVEAIIRTELSPVMRVHAGGDFFSVPYLQNWIDIANGRPDVRFYAYTRSWQDGHGAIADDFIGPLREMSELDNFRLILSLDRETGIPDRELIPAAIRSWLATDDKDVPSEPVELVFRDPPAMGKKIMANMGGTTVCPVERLKSYKKISGKVSCQNCSWCWSTGHMAYGMRDDDPDQFDGFAGTNLRVRVGKMFQKYWPTAPGLSGARAASCKCGAGAFCVFCESCVGCLCACSEMMPTV